MAKKLLATALLSLGALIIFIVIPSPIDPVAYSPKEARPLTGKWLANDALKTAKLWGKGQIVGPEDVAIDSQGRLYGGLKNGDIIRIDSNDNVSIFANTGGRPLGLHFDANENLIVADAMKGLLKIDQAGSITVLATEADNLPFGLTDDLDITQDGTIIFSDASSKWGVRQYKNDTLESKPYGRLIAYDPSTKQTDVLLEGLYFANGVALSQDDSFVLVNETWRYRITRLWLKGAQKGQHEIFADNLPGFPDGISSNKDGTFWLAIAAPRNPLLDMSHPYPWLKKQMSKLPKFLQPKAKPYGFVVALNEEGQVIKTLHDTTGSVVSEITSVEQFGKRLLLGTLNGDRIGEIASPF